MWKKIRNKKMIRILEESDVKKIRLLWQFNPMIDCIEYVFKNATKEEVIKKLMRDDTECYQETDNVFHVIDKWVSNFDYEVILDVSKSKSETE